MINATKDKLDYQDEINLNCAKILDSLDVNFFKNNIFNIDEEDDSGNKYKFEDYFKNFKKWLKIIIKTNGKKSTKYKYSKYLIDKGRIYVEKFGIQSLQRDLRGFLCNDIYYDLDIANCHPCILLYLQKTFFPNHEVNYLTTYINNRNDTLNKFNITKKDILKILNSEWSYKGKNEFLKGLSFEINKLQIDIYDSDEFLTIPKEDIKIKNKRGSFLNRVLCVYENIILQEAILKIKISVPMCDGFFIKKCYIENIDNIINMLDDNKYGLKWIEKKHSTVIEQKIKVDNNNNLPIYETEYDLMKKEFEENHFILKYPISYCSIDNPKKELRLYNRASFIDLTAPFQFEEDGKIKNFFLTWIKDINRKSFDKMDFIPDKTQCPDDIYNMFKGFKCEYIDKLDRQDTYLFYELLDVISDNNQPFREYLISYISDIFQNPCKSCKTAIFLKGVEGSGKDMMINFIQNIMGHDYVWNTNIEQLCTKFNNGLSQKIIINLQEVEGMSAHKNKAYLKEFITEHEHRIESKGISAWYETNYSRVFASSNDDNAIHVSNKERRWTVKSTGIPREKEFYNDLGKVINNRQYLNSLYSEFMDYKIECDITKPHFTQEMIEQQELSINPLFKFCYEMFKRKDILNDDYKSYTYIDKKDKDFIFIRNEHFFEMYSTFITDNEEYGSNYLSKVNFRKFKLLLQKVDILAVSKTINNKTYRGYGIKLNHNFEKLKSMYDWDKYEF